MAVTIVRVIDLVAQVFQWILFAYVIISWIPQLRNSAVGHIIGVLTEPVLKPIQWLIDRSPLARSPISFSAIFAFLMIGVISSLLKGLVLWLT